MRTMTVPMKQMHQWTRQQQQIRKSAEKTRTIGNDEEPGYGQEPEQDTFRNEARSANNKAISRIHLILQ